MILENVKVQWAKLGDNAGNKYMSDEKEWSIDVIMSPEQVTKWTEAGISPKVKDKDGVMIVTLRKDCVFKKSGDPQKPPMVVDQFGKPLDVLVGNGSVTNVQFNVHEWEFQGKKGKTARLVAVQVLDLVEFTGGGDSNEFTFDVEEVAVLDDKEDLPF